VTRNPTKAQEVVVPFGAITDGTLELGDTLKVAFLTRIGTNPDDSKCGGHNNAVGLRLYYDSDSRPSRAGVEIAPDPLGDYFLHSSGTDFFMDSNWPTETAAKQKDSGRVNFAGGNPWVLIGTWKREVP
jgi:hypothetical protein